MVSFILLDSEVINIYFLYIAFVFTSTLGILFDRKRPVSCRILCSNVYFYRVSLDLLKSNIWARIFTRKLIIGYTLYMLFLSLLCWSFIISNAGYLNPNPQNEYFLMISI